MNRLWLRVLVFVAMVVVSILASTHSAYAWSAPGVEGEDPIVLDRGWEYRWGDEPAASPTTPPAWAQDGDRSGWTPMEAPYGPPPGRGTNTVLWMRVPMPEGHWRDPALYFYQVEQTVEVFTRSGARTASTRRGSDGALAFDGRPPFIVTVAPSDLGHDVYFRVEAHRAAYIGVYSDVVLGARATLLRRLVGRELPSLLVSCFVFVMALVGAGLFLVHRRDVTYASFAGFCLVSALYTLSKNDAWLLVTGAPLVWRYFEVFCLAAAPAVSMGFFSALFGEGWMGVMRLSFIIFTVFTALAVLAVALGLITVNQPIAAAQVDVLLGCAIFASHAVVWAIGGDREARIFLLGFTLFLLGCLADVATSVAILTLPFQLAQFGAFGLLVSTAVVLGLRFFVAQDEKARLDAELAAASAVQKSLLPETLALPTLDITATYASASQTGGDWYGHTYDADGQRVSLFVGDVMGHGIPSALLTGVVCGAVYGAERRSDAGFNRIPNLADPPRSKTFAARSNVEDIARVTSRVLYRTGQGRMLMSMVCLSIDIVRGRVTVLNAGHPPPFLLRAKEGRAHAIVSRGEPLGDRHEVRAQTYTVDLQPGDAIFLYTDGLLENPGPSGELFGRRRLEQALSAAYSSSKEVHDRVMIAARDLWRGAAAPDDVTAVALVWTGPPGSGNVTSAKGR